LPPSLAGQFAAAGARGGAADGRVRVDSLSSEGDVSVVGDRWVGKRVRAVRAHARGEREQLPLEQGARLLAELSSRLECPA
jgi:hypothetical protein